MVAIRIDADPTLTAMDVALEATSIKQPRHYLGASSIGNPCSRALWYGFRWSVARLIPAIGLRRINDGFRGEDVMIKLLRAVPGVTLWTENPDQPNKQISFQDFEGHFGGNLDGIIEGLLQAPKTPHVWECKICNEKKVQKLSVLKSEKGEKAALAAWDETYFAQAQIYMHYMELTRHYLTVGTPGVRDIVSCRTNYQPKVAKRLIEKAKTIITAERPPLKLSENPAWYQCKWCDYSKLCHGKAIPLVNCRVCAHATPQIDSVNPWICTQHKKGIRVPEQRVGCAHHAFHPDLLENHAKSVAVDSATGAITFQLKETPEIEFVNGYNAVCSQMIFDRDQESPESVDIRSDQIVLSALSTDSDIPIATLQSGDLTEDRDWPAIVESAKRLFDFWKDDVQRVQVLKDVIEAIDSVYEIRRLKIQRIKGPDETP